MSKIIGNTVGMGLPKPNLMQTDPTKGDYVKGKEEFLAQAGYGSGQNPPQDGEDGFSPLATVTQTEDGATISITDANGTTTATVTNGKDGKDGADGYTPVKGVDYWTAAEQEAIVQQVIAALGTPVFGRVDGENDIILTGELADGTYTVKYEDGEGNVTEIGTIDLGAPSVFDVPITWQIGVKLNKNDGTVEATNEAKYNASDAIPLVSGARYVVATTNDCYNKMSIVYYNDNDVFVGYQADVWASRECEPEEGQPASADLVIPAGATKIRLRQYEVWNTQGASTKFVTLTGTL